MSKTHWLAASSLFTLMLGVGALVLFAFANQVGHVLGRPSALAVTVAAGLAATATLLGHGQPTLSRWRVPVDWQRRGHVQFAGLFGFSLGLGLVTNLPSVGLFVLIILSASAGDGYLPALIAIGFATGRTIPFLSVVIRNRDRDQRWLHAYIQQVAMLAAKMRSVEVALLAAVAVSTMLGSWQ